MFLSELGGRGGTLFKLLSSFIIFHPPPRSALSTFLRYLTWVWYFSEIAIHLARFQIRFQIFIFWVFRVSRGKGKMWECFAGETRKTLPHTRSTTQSPKEPIFFGKSL